MNTENLKFTPETLSSLAAKYDVTVKTFKRWIKDFDDELKRKRKVPFTPIQLEMIVDNLGPYN